MTSISLCAGIPSQEEGQEKRYGKSEAFREYKKHTNTIIPWCVAASELALLPADAKWPDMIYCMQQCAAAYSNAWPEPRCMRRFPSSKP